MAVYYKNLDISTLTELIAFVRQSTSCTSNLFKILDRDNGVEYLAIAENEAKLHENLKIGPRPTSQYVISQLNITENHDAQRI